MSSRFSSLFRQKLFYFFILLLNLSSVQLLAQNHDDFVVIAPPKCGTHLIGKTLQLMLKKEGAYYLGEELNGTAETGLALIEENKKQNKFVVAHNYSEDLIHTLLQKKYKIIFILRDPRDQLISLVHHFKNGQWSWLKVSQMTDPNEQIEELITGSRYKYKAYERSIGGRFAKVEKLSTKIMYVTKFESVVGPQGLGTEEAQTTELLNISKFLHYKLSVNEAKSVGKNLFGGTWSFREGKIGEWKKVFTDEHKRLYRDIYGRTLIKLGYESNYKW